MVQSAVPPGISLVRTRHGDSEPRSEACLFNSFFSSSIFVQVLGRSEDCRIWPRVGIEVGTTKRKLGAEKQVGLCVHCLAFGPFLSYAGKDVKYRWVCAEERRKGSH